MRKFGGGSPGLYDPPHIKFIQIEYVVVEIWRGGGAAKGPPLRGEGLLSLCLHRAYPHRPAPFLNTNISRCKNLAEDLRSSRILLIPKLYDLDMWLRRFCVEGVAAKGLQQEITQGLAALP
jgi:hypothetical protein